MTLRDYFAGQALAGILGGFPHGETPQPKASAREAYEFADAMLKAREES